MLTDELFGVESKSLTDQLFAGKPKSLTDQLVSEETPSKPDVSGIAKGLKAEHAREAFPETTIQQRYMKELLAPSVEEFDILKTDPIIKSVGKSLKEVAKTAGMEVVATSELAMSLASGMLLYIPSKLY